MQAGESLSFLRPPTELSIPERLPEDEASAVALAYVHALNRIADRYPDAFESITSDNITATEGSFQVLHTDGSYLHIAVFTIQDEGGILSIGVSAVEHNDEGYYLGGYIFELTGAEVTYAQHCTPDDSLDDDEARMHFSSIVHFKNKEMLYQLMLSEDEAVREAAENSWKQAQDEAELALYEHELGFSTGRATLEDIEKLQAIIDMASPFSTASVE